MIVELPFNDEKDASLFNIPLCYVCNFIMHNIADVTIDDRVKNGELMTEKDIERITVHLEVEPEYDEEE